MARLPYVWNTANGSLDSNNWGDVLNAYLSIGHNADGSHRAWTNVVEQYGAVGDGVADDTVAIQAAFDAMATSQGRVYFPRGVYKVSAQLTISNREGFVIEGAGMASSQLAPTAALAGLGVLKLTNNRDSLIRDLGILGHASAPAAGIQYHRGAAGGFAPTNNIVSHVLLGSTTADSLTNGVRYTADVDTNNAESVLHNVKILNVTSACVSIEHSNSLGHRFFGLTCSAPSATASVGVRTNGGSFHAYGVAFAVTGWDFDLAGTQRHGSSVTGGYSEGSSNLARMAAVTDGSLAITGFFKKGGAAGPVLIDWAGTTRSVFTLVGSYLTTGGTPEIRFTDTSSRATLIGNFLGVGTVTWNGHLTLSGNHFDPGSVTLTPGGSATFGRAWNVGGGFAGGDVSLNTAGKLVAGSNTLIGNVADKLNAAHLAIASQAIGDLLAANSTTGFTRIAAGADGTVLRGAGAGISPLYGAVRLSGATKDITGTLGVGDGGTGLTAGTDGGILGFTATGTLASSGLLTANALILGGGAGATPTSLANASAGQVLTSGTPPAYSATPTLTDLTLTGQAKLASGAAGTTSLFFSADGQTAGWFRGAANAWDWSNASAVRFRLFSTASGGKVEILGGTADCQFGFGTIGSVDACLSRQAADRIALVRGTNAQELDIFGTTTGPKYGLLKHDATDFLIDTAASSGSVKIATTNATTTTITGRNDAAALTVTGGSVTGSGTTVLHPITGTYNTTGVVPGLLQVNLTNTASGAGSRTLELQRAGTLQFGVTTGATSTGTQIRTAQQTAPTCSSNCGTSPSVSGSDTFMTVTMGSSGSPASGWVVTFNGTWATAPACAVFPALAGMVVGKTAIVVATTTTTVTVTTNGTAPATSDKYHVVCGGIS
jgi:hypothetical protein